MFYPLIITYTSDEYYEVNIPDFKLELGAYGETEEEAIDMEKMLLSVNWNYWKRNVKNILNQVVQGNCQKK